MSVLHIISYLAILVFLVLSLKRIIRIATAPVHLRWELYPVPHEKGRAHYGGSRAEEVDWWEKPIEKDHLNEAFTMAQEIILLKAVWEHNRKLWYGSFPLHFALYVLIINMFLLIVAGIMTVAGTAVNSDSTGFAGLLSTIIPILTVGGCVLGLIGAIIMMYLRIADTELAKYSTASHYFNIILLGVIYLTGFMWVLNDALFIENITKYYAGLISFSAFDGLELYPGAYAHIGSVLFFLFYMPITHMTHFFMKYFTYHSVRWDDEPNLQGSNIEKRIAEQLNYPVSWSAPHIGADGKKTWVAIATEMPEDK